MVMLICDNGMNYRMVINALNNSHNTMMNLSTLVHNLEIQMTMMIMTHSQLLEGLKCESK
jgi:hypothetical protein